jgi:hypothetical protein
VRTIFTKQHVTRDEWGWAHGPGWELRFGFEPRDLWVGVYWTRSESGGMLDVYVCLLPAFPVHLCYWSGR